MRVLCEKDVKDERLQASLRFIATHYANEITIADLCAAANGNRATLSRLFMQELGVTATQYLKAYRVKIAQERLLFTDTPIKVIAQECGFKTVPHFTRCFKEETGATPAVYRQNETEKQRAKEALTVDVVLDDFTHNQMYYTSRERFSQILTVGFFLGEGPICAFDESRWRFYDTYITHMCVRDKDKDYLANVQRLRDHAAKGLPLRIWRTLKIADTVCLFAYLCDVLKEYDCPIEVVDHPDSTLESWGFVNDGFEKYLPYAKPLAKDEMERYAALWHRLQSENTLLRVMENGDVKSVPEEYWDDCLERVLPTPDSGVQRVDAVAAYATDRHEPNYHFWFRYRLQRYIKQGVLEYVPVIGGEEETLVRHKDAPKSVTMEDLREVACANMPHPLDKPPHLPDAQVWVVLSASGRVYAVPNDDIDKLLALLAENGDTRIEKWVTLWFRRHYPDVPSFAARRAILSLDPANADALLLLQGGRQTYEKRIGDTMAPSDTE